ncbi:MAG: hypothetical protein ACRD3E_09875, partial [Terriglobales bacterium]
GRAVEGGDGETLVSVSSFSFRRRGSAETPGLFSYRVIGSSGHRVIMSTPGVVVPMTQRPDPFSLET